MIPVLAVDADAISEISIDPWSLLWATLSVIVAWVLSRVTRRAVSRLLSALVGISEQLNKVIASTAGYLVLFVGIGVALSFLGAQIQPILATVLIIAVVMALALRGLAENFAAGIVIQSRQIIHPGDEIESLEFNGLVKEINSTPRTDAWSISPTPRCWPTLWSMTPSMGRADRRSRSGWNPGMWSERRSVSSVRLRHHRA